MLSDTTILSDLTIKAERLLRQSRVLGLRTESRHFERLYAELTCLLRKSQFSITAQAQGRTLLVGEGNLSFALSLAQQPKLSAPRLVATTFEGQNEISETTSDNAKLLRNLGALVLHGVDATNLADSFGSWLFDTIIFQFPHTGSREPVEKRNPNFILLRNFLQSAAGQLQRAGKVIVTTVDSPHYDGAFQVEDAADAAGFRPPERYPFEPEDFSGYEHTMTNEDDSALENHDAFVTWVFRTQ